MYMFLAKYKEAADVLIGPANDGDDALKQLAVHGIDATPIRLVALPRGIVCADVIWSDDDGGDGDNDDGDVNPANVAEGGVVLEPSDLFGDWLETEATADNVVTARAELGEAPTEPAPPESEGG